MSTIAYKDGIMACEGQVTLNEMAVMYDFEKIFVEDLTDNSHVVIGLTGVPSDLPMVISNVRNLLAGKEAEYAPECRAVVVVVTSDEKSKTENAYIYENSGLLPMKQNFMAVGSGDVFAMSAMHNGKTAIEAVKTACFFDVYSGGNLKKVEVSTKKTTFPKK